MRNELSILATALGLFSVAIAEPSHSDPGSMLGKIESTARSLHGFTCKLETLRTYSSARHPGLKIEETLDVTFQRPNRFTISSKASNEPNSYRATSDGQNVYFSLPKNYTKGTIDRKAEDFHWYHNDFLLLLVTGSFEKALEFPVKPKSSALPDEQWDGRTYHVIDLALGGGYPIDYKVFYDDEHIVHRILHTEFDGGKPFIEDVAVLDFQKNPAVDPSTFHFTPGPDQKPLDESLYRRGETPLIMVGRPAAPFSLPTPDGPRLSLGDALKGKKALLLNFWFVHCPPCRAEHPKLDKLYREFKDQGLEVLSIDDQDTPEAVANYWKGAGLTFRTVLSGPMAAIDPKTGYPDYRGPKLPDYAELVPYGVHECPTNILLNSEGEVVYVSQAWDEAGLRKALDSLDVR